MCILQPISVIAPFTQGNTHNFTQSAKSSTPTRGIPNLCNKIIQRHQSFHGFLNNKGQIQPSAGLPPRFNFNSSNPYLNSVNNSQGWPNNNKFYSRNITHRPFRFAQSQSNLQPLLNFNPFLLPNPFSIPPNRNRVAGRRETDIRRTASGINISENELFDVDNASKTVAKQEHDDDDDKRFGSLEIKKHKCYSPTFYSMRCRKHAKKRTVVYALPKKVLSEKNDENTDIFQNLTDSIQICEKHNNSTDQSKPIPAPRCKKHKINSLDLKESKIDTSASSNDSNDGSEILASEVSIIEAQIHNQNEKSESETSQINTSNNEGDPVKQLVRSPPKLVGVSPKPNVPLNQSGSSNIIKVEALKAMKNSPTLKVSPNFIKPKTESPKGALSLQIQAKIKNSNDNPNSQSDDSKENLPLVPQQMPLLSPQKKWSPGLSNANQLQQVCFCCYFFLLLKY